MNESILKALMRLFAIVANLGKMPNSGNEREIVVDYLERQYSNEIVQKFIQYFDEQVTFYHSNNKDNVDSENTTPYQSIIDICTQINLELEQEQKLIVLIYLIDCLNRSNEFSEDESRFLYTLVGELKLDRAEFIDLQYFTLNKNSNVVNKDRLLFIDAEGKNEDPEIKHFPSGKLDGRIVVLHLPGTNTYVFRYYGPMVLYINGQSIKSNRSYIWPGGAVIKNSKIGPLYFNRISGKFINANIENKFVFTAEDIEYSYRNSGNGLKRFTLNEESGRLIGIIGGSGSGKSTLLNVLNGNIKPKSGIIRINGFDIHENKELLKGVIGFSPQDDVLIKELTVYQNLYFNARLCFSDMSEEDLKKIVDNALIDFDLVEARNLNVGDSFTTILSGGQRKRLNIALELIREPSILFVDEPTSGLSSADSEKIITLLKRQALKGKLVITNIHQPSSDVFKMFDKLLVMDQGGRIIYYGNPMSSISYFKRAAKQPDAEEAECNECGNINSDQILRVVEARVVGTNGRLTRKRKTSPEEWYQSYMKNIDVKVRRTLRAHDSSVPKNNFKIPGHAKQFRIFLERDLLAKLHNQQYLFITALEAPVLALILSFFTKKYIFTNGIPTYFFSENLNIPAFIFMAIIVAIFMGLVISAEELFKDQKILKREKFLNLSRSSYLFSKIGILFSISAIQTLVFVLISSMMLDIRGMWYYYWIILFSVSCWANLVGLILSSGFKTVVTIYILVPIVLVPQLLLSGVVVNFNDMHRRIASQKEVPVIGDLMTCRWAYEALMVSQFKYNRFERNFYDAEQDIHQSTYYKSFAIPELEKINNEVQQLLIDGKDTSRIINKLEILQHGVNKIAVDLMEPIPAFSDSLNIALCKPSVLLAVDQYFDRATRSFVKHSNNSIAIKDQTYNRMVEKLGSHDDFLKLRQHYHNKQVSLVVTNANELYETAIIGNELVPLKDAIYHIPDAKNGRSHYYAPVKRVSNILIDTFWFNLIIIWLYSILMFVILYFDVLKRSISYVETLLLVRRNRIRLLRLLKVYEQTENFFTGKKK